jgi:site-specific DNA-methyltransferase (adenine-specific)
MTKVEHIAEGVTLYLGDCRELLPSIAKVDAVVTDPPYGLGHRHSGKGKTTHLKKSGAALVKQNTRPVIGDDEPFDPLPFVRVAPFLLFFGGDHFADRLPPGGIFHVWDKECGRSGRNDTFSDAEIFWTNWAGKRRVIRYLWKGLQTEDGSGGDKERFHPTQKPIDVMRQCIDMCPGIISTIFDPFMGSGTTGIAAVQSGRKFIGVEIEPTYFDIACTRIEAATKQADLFIEKPKPAKQEALL